MPDINGIPYVESTDLVSGWPTVSQSVAQEVSDQLASKLPYSYGTATPSTTDSGFLWYDSNSTPPVPKYWNGSSFATLAPAPGLELITSETFSAVSSVSLDGCFSATYENYKIMFFSTNSSNGRANLRLRASGTDSSSDYSGKLIDAFGTTNLTGQSISATVFPLFYNENTSIMFASMDVLRPFDASPTAVFSMGQDSAPAFRIMSGRHTASTSYDGFSLIASAGNIEGTIRVYGYKD